jgi:hypothetical protein
VQAVQQVEDLAARRLASCEEPIPNGRVDEHHSRRPTLATRVLAPPRDILRPGLGAPQRAEPRERGALQERFQPEPYGLGVGGGAARRPRLGEQRGLVPLTGSSCRQLARGRRTSRDPMAAAP